MMRSNDRFLEGVSPRLRVFWLCTMGPASFILCIWPSVAGISWFGFTAFIFLAILGLGEFLRLIGQLVERRRGRTRHDAP